MTKLWTITIILTALILLSVKSAGASLPPLVINQYILDNVMAGDPTPQPNNEALKAIIRDIDAATVSVNIASYGLNHQKIVDALVRAHNRGVLVSMVAHGEYVDTGSAYHDYYQQIIDAGIPVVARPASPSGLMHSKFIVMDNYLVYMGSANWTVTGFYYNNNTVWRIEDTRLAAAYLCEFNQMYMGNFGTGKSIDCGTTLEYAGGESLTVMFTPTNGAEYEARLVSETNQSDMALVRAFYLTLDTFGSALVDVARRGGYVSAIMDANGFGDGVSFGSEGQKLCDAGIGVWVDFWGGKPHNKTAYFRHLDGSVTIVNGSPNFSFNARARNDENVIFLHLPSDTHSLARQWLESFNRVLAEFAPFHECRPTSAENNIPACDDKMWTLVDGRWQWVELDNDHDGYTNGYTGSSTGWDFDCAEATRRHCIDDLDNNGNGYIDDLSQDGCYMLTKLCPDTYWLPPIVDHDEATILLRWYSADGATMALYKSDNPYDFSEANIMGMTDGDSWEMPLPDKPVYIMLLRHNYEGLGCLDMQLPPSYGVMPFV